MDLENNLTHVTTYPVGMKELTELTELKKHLKYGDMVIISKMVGCSRELVKKVLNGQRGIYSINGMKIMEIAKAIAELRKHPEQAEQ